MNKFRTHTHRIMGFSRIYTIRPQVESRMLQVLAITNTEDDSHTYRYDILYISERVARAVYHHSIHDNDDLCYKDITISDAWSPYNESH